MSGGRCTRSEDRLATLCTPRSAISLLPPPSSTPALSAGSRITCALRPYSCPILLSSLPPRVLLAASPPHAGSSAPLTSIALLSTLRCALRSSTLHVTTDSRSTLQDPSRLSARALPDCAALYPGMLRPTPPGRPDKLKPSRPLVQAITSVFSGLCRLESLDLLIEDASQFMDTAHFPNLSAF
ncbi:hypothetical protein DFH08DRAFT_331410 [Mycena albidolilacea]|uniref:Uncharacterized protein n=1 Tax=Mycena albidolilacea TaxID=1033008 RepID=A0AAD6ZLD3_9AGAR|nr:hypothetical protein DFH08DRAFT_331410 [Mycena albidolilacea]